MVLFDVVTGINIVKGFAAIPLASSTNEVVKYGFPAVESVIDLVWNLSVIMNIVDKHSRWEST